MEAVQLLSNRADEDEDGEDDEEFSEEQLLKLPPVGPPSWDSNVVCIQPTRNHSRPEGHDESEEKQNNNNNVSPRRETKVPQPLPHLLHSGAPENSTFSPMCTALQQTWFLSASCLTETVAAFPSPLELYTTSTC